MTTYWRRHGLLIVTAHCHACTVTQPASRLLPRRATTPTLSTKPSLPGPSHPPPGPTPPDALLAKLAAHLKQRCLPMVTRRLRRRSSFRRKASTPRRHRRPRARACRRCACRRPRFRSCSPPVALPSIFLLHKESSRFIPEQKPTALDCA